jgi:hypothetical protein
MPALPTPKIADVQREIAALPAHPRAYVDHDQRHQGPALVQLAEERSPVDEVGRRADVGAGVGSETRDLFKQVAGRRDGGNRPEGEPGVAGKIALRRLNSCKSGIVSGLIPRERAISLTTDDRRRVPPRPTHDQGSLGDGRSRY